jgi:hypothetical protein
MIGAATLQQIAETIERTARAGDLAGVRRMQAPLRLAILDVAGQAGFDGSELH